MHRFIPCGTKLPIIGINGLDSCCVAADSLVQCVAEKTWQESRRLLYTFRSWEAKWKSRLSTSSLYCEEETETVKASKPLEFIAHAQTDAKTSARVQAAIEKGSMVTAAEVLKIAKSAGFDFTREQFERAVKKSYAERFAAGDKSLADVVAKAKPRPPESSCARGCLSYTKSWHPRKFTQTP